MTSYRIYTSGPVTTYTCDTTADVRAHVESHAPMKRGWTATWRTNPDGSMTYLRSNSRGRVLPGYGITVVALPPCA